MKLDVNTKATIALTAKLEKLHRSAFPSAVRNTLNDAAFDMKRKTLIDSANSNFKVKNKTFFKKFSGVEKASGFDLKSMKATAGFPVPSDIKAKTAIDGLEKQETGSSISNGLRYLKGARSGSLNRLVQKKSYYNKSRVTKSVKKGGSKANYIATAYSALKTGNPFFLETNKGRFLIKVNSIKSNSGRGLNISTTPLMMERKVKPSKIKATHFAEEAADKTTKKIEGFYEKNAQYQFQKALK